MTKIKPRESERLRAVAIAWTKIPKEKRILMIQEKITLHRIKKATRFICTLCDVTISSLPDVFKHIESNLHESSRCFYSAKLTLMSIQKLHPWHLECLAKTLNATYQQRLISENESQRINTLINNLLGIINGVEMNDSFKISLAGCHELGLVGRESHVDFIVFNVNRDKSLGEFGLPLDIIQKRIKECPSIGIEPVKNNTRNSSMLVYQDNNGTLFRFTLVEVIYTRVLDLLKAYLKISPTLAKLAFLFRSYLRISHVDFISTEMILLMIIFFLQNSGFKFPNLQALWRMKNGVADTEDGTVSAEYFNYLEHDMVTEEHLDDEELANNFASLWLKLLRFYTFNFRYRQFLVSIRNVMPVVKIKQTNENQLVFEHPFMLNANLFALSKEQTNYLNLQLFAGYSYFLIPRLASTKRPLFSKVNASCKEPYPQTNDLLKIYDALGNKSMDLNSIKIQSIDQTKTKDQSSVKNETAKKNENLHILLELDDIDDFNTQISAITNVIYSKQYDLVKMSREPCPNEEGQDEEEEELFDRNFNATNSIKPSSLLRTLIKYIFSLLFEESMIEDLCDEFLTFNDEDPEFQAWINTGLVMDDFVRAIQNFVQSFLTSITSKYVKEGCFVIKRTALFNLLITAFNSVYEPQDSSGSTNRSLNETLEIEIEESKQDLDVASINELIDRIYVEEINEEGILKELFQLKQLMSRKNLSAKRIKIEINKKYTWSQAVHDFAQDFEITDCYEEGYYNESLDKVLDHKVELDHEISPHGCISGSACKLESSILGLKFPNQPSTMLFLYEPLPVACYGCGSTQHFYEDCDMSLDATISFKRWLLVKSDVGLVSSIGLGNLSQAITQLADIQHKYSNLELKMNRFRSMRDIIKRFYPNSELVVFGSCANGLESYTSDIDACLYFDKSLDLSKPADLKKFMMNLKRFSYDKFKRFDLVNATVIFAKVPIISLCFRDGFQFDISFTNTLAIKNTGLILKYVQLFEPLRKLCLCLKSVSKFLKIGSAKDGYISSYGYTLMMIYYLQRKNFLPVLQELYTTKKKPVVMHDGWNVWYQTDDKVIAELWTPPKNYNIGQLWLGFFYFYLFEFDREQYVVSIRKSEPLSKTLALWNGLISIEDPFCLSHELTCNLKREEFNKILHSFYLILLKTISKLSQSLSYSWKYDIFFNPELIIKSNDRSKGPVSRIDTRLKSEQNQLLWNMLVGKRQKMSNSNIILAPHFLAPHFLPPILHYHLQQSLALNSLQKQSVRAQSTHKESIKSMGKKYKAPLSPAPPQREQVANGTQPLQATNQIMARRNRNKNNNNLNNQTRSASTCSVPANMTPNVQPVVDNESRPSKKPARKTKENTKPSVIDKNALSGAVEKAVDRANPKDKDLMEGNL